MKFDIKKDWAKLTMAVIAGVLGLLYVIAIFVKMPLVSGATYKLSGLDMLKAPYNTAYGFSMFAMYYLIPALFFLGVCTYIMLKLFGMKDIAKYVLLCVGVINLILFIIVLIDNGFPGISGMELSMSWAPLVIYALFPIIKGVKKIVCCCEEEKAAAPKAAPATPVAAPKAAAKK